MSKTNAERQREWRRRQKEKRNGSNGAVAIARNTANRNEDQIVQARANHEDYVGADGHQRVFLGDWGYGPCYTLIVNPTMRHTL